VGKSTLAKYLVSIAIGFGQLVSLLEHYNNLTGDIIMATMGKYCQAYLLNNLRQFSRWTEKIENVKKEKKQVDGKEVEFDRQLTDDDILYMLIRFS